MMRTWIPAASIAFAMWAAGCGDDAQPGCDPDDPCAAGTGTGEDGTSGSSGSGVSVSSTSAAATSSSADGTAEATSLDAGSDASSSSDSDVTTAADGSGGSDTTAAESSSTGDPGNVEYSAQALIGALDRILVFREDLDEDRCTWIILVSPGFAGPYDDVSTPKGWSVQSIQANDVGEACGSPSPSMFGAETATAAEGTIELGAVGPSGVYPCDVTVDVTAMFDGLLPNVPPSDLLEAVAIPVTGC